jgi:hypothetical protein
MFWHKRLDDLTNGHFGISGSMKKALKDNLMVRGDVN